MKVEIKRAVSGLLNGAYWPKPGEVVEVEDAIAHVLHRKGIAVPLADEAEPDGDDEASSDPAPDGEVKRGPGRPRKDAD